MANNTRGEIISDYDEFIEGLSTGYDDGEIRGEWSKRPQVIIPKLGEVAILLGLYLEDADDGHNPPDIDSCQ